MSAPQPIAVFGDTVTIVIALFAMRLLLLALRGEARWAGFAATWMRRIAVVAMVMLVLRLSSIAVMRPEIAAPVSWVIVSILAAGAATLMVDHILTDLLRSRRRQ